MSGTPDLTLIFTTPGVIEDASFHPCVRLARWEREQVRRQAEEEAGGD
jgi:AP-3 complex subunit mu